MAHNTGRARWTHLIVFLTNESQHLHPNRLMQNILITGATGLIGTAVVASLGKHYKLRALNRRPLPNLDCHQADIADLDAIRPAFAGIDAVVHLAAQIENDIAAIFRANLQGTGNVLAAAREAGVRRVLFASSGSVMGGYAVLSPYKELLAGEYDQVPATWPMLTAQSPLRPTGLYAASKVWGEELGREYAAAYGMSVLCLRFGRVNPENRPTHSREFCVWCSQRDAAQMIEKCLAAPLDLPFDTFFVNSDNKWGYRDLQHARHAVGFVPADRAEDYR